MVALMSLTKLVSDKSVCYYRDLSIQQCSRTLSLFVFCSTGGIIETDEIPDIMLCNVFADAR